jgi:hypothetical protein
LFSPPKALCLVCEISIDFNLKPEFHCPLREIGEIDVFVNTQTYRARYLQLDGFF